MPLPPRPTALAAGFLACVTIGLFSLNWALDFPVANQHTYMLHAFRLLGMPGLARDWMAHTMDPAPLVTLLSAAAWRLGGAAGIAALYAGCCLIFAGCWYRLATGRFGLGPLAQFLALPVLLLPFLNPVNMWLSHGVAEQYFLGGYWQPSEAAGAALLFALTLLVLDRPHAAAVLAALAAALHPGSLLAAGLVGGTVVLDLLLRRAWRRAATAAALHAFCLLPVILYALVALGPGAAEAARILVHERIPHHTLPAEWLGPRTVFCLALIAGAMLAFRRDRRVLLALGVPAGAGILASLAVALADRDRAYLLFPWRISAVLVPFAWLLLSIAAGRGLARLLQPWQGLGRWAASPTGRLAAMAFILAGAAVAPLSPFARTVYPRNYAAPLRAWLQTRTTPEDVILIPLEAEWVRLKAGRAVLVDWKSNPFRGEEVIEWWRRIGLSRRITGEFCKTGHMPEEAAAMASLVLVKRHGGCRADPAGAVYSDADFAVYRTGQGGGPQG